MKSMCQDARRNSPSVADCRPTSSCIAIAPGITSSSTARRSAAVIVPAAKSSRAISSRWGRSRLPTWSARNGGLVLRAMVILSAALLVCGAAGLRLCGSAGLRRFPANSFPIMRSSSLRMSHVPHRAAGHRSYSHVVSSLLDAEEIGDAEPWLSPGAAAQRPPRLLLTLLGDYWWQRTEPLPSAAIVALLAEFGVSDSAARAALSRLTRNGLLVTSKSGRRTYARLSARAAAILDDGARRIFSFGAASRPWDGMWSLVAFSIPEDNRAARDALRKQLRWRGFAPLYDGLWVSPRDHAAEVIGYLKDLDITTGTAFRASAVPTGMVPADGDIPARDWDL